MKEPKIDSRPRRKAICEGCGAAIFWALHETTGTPAPLNWEPERAGDLLLVNQESREPIYRHLTLWDKRPAELFTSHFMDCPKADEFRKAE